MRRPIFNSSALWDSLTPEQQRAIGIAAIDREIVAHGREFVDVPGLIDVFSGYENQVDGALWLAVGAVLDLDFVSEDDYPLPGCAKLAPDRPA